MIVRWHSSKRAVADNEIENWYQRVLNDCPEEIEVSSETELLRLRIGVKEGEISSMVVLVDDTEIRVDKYGRMEFWPDTLCVKDELLSRFLGI